MLKNFILETQKTDRKLREICSLLKCDKEHILKKSKTLIDKLENNEILIHKLKNQIKELNA